MPRGSILGFNDWITGEDYELQTRYNVENSAFSLRFVKINTLEPVAEFQIPPDMAQAISHEFTRLCDELREESEED
jgi:hypothetical protein